MAVRADTKHRAFAARLRNGGGQHEKNPQKAVSSTRKSRYRTTVHHGTDYPPDVRALSMTGLY